MFHRIRRFQHVLRLIEGRQAVWWADVATACGYYDQPHFIRDFQASFGLNPSAHLTERGEISTVPSAS
jgi:AraC-like DNA-binding protein